MTYILNTPYPSIQIYLDSRTATTKRRNNSDLIFHFNDKIQVKQDNIDILLSVQDFEMPLCFYNINEKNNKLVIEYDDFTTETIYIEEGIYSADSLVIYIKSLLDQSNLIDCFYNEKANYIYLVSNQNFNISNSVIGEILQKNNDIVIEDNKYYYGSYLNLSSISSIYIHCPTFTTFNLSSRESGHTDTICKIPVNNHINNILVWENQHNFKSKINEKIISDIEIILTDENNDIIYLQDNCHWTATLQIDFIYKQHLRLNSGINKIQKIDKVIKKKKIVKKNKDKN